MLLIDKIKEDQVQARKDRTEVAAKLLTTLLGEASAIGKNDGNRQTKDEEVIAVVKKFIKGIDETSTYVSDIYVKDVLKQEKEILTGYLPKQLTNKEIESYIVQAVIHDGLQQNKGSMMKYLKDYFNGQYDGKVAVTIIDDILKQKYPVAQ